jgi:hypothetical protein
MCSVSHEPIKPGARYAGRAHDQYSKAQPGALCPRAHIWRLITPAEIAISTERKGTFNAKAERRKDRKDLY